MEFDYQPVLQLIAGDSLNAELITHIYGGNDLPGLTDLKIATKIITKILIQRHQELKNAFNFLTKEIYTSEGRKIANELRKKLKKNSTKEDDDEVLYNYVRERFDVKDVYEIEPFMTYPANVREAKRMKRKDEKNKLFARKKRDKPADLQKIREKYGKKRKYKPK